MKQLLLLNLLFIFSTGFTQVNETIHLKKEYKESDFHPQIEGVFTGEIDILKLGSLNGITINAKWKICSFKLEFQAGRDSKIVKIKSNKIPQEIIEEIVKGSLREQIYFTEIIALDELNTEHLLKSMVLIPVINE